MSKRSQKIIALVFLVVMAILAWMGNGYEVYWRIFQFKIRNHAFMKEGKCITIGNFYGASRAVDTEKLDTRFLEKDYPRLFPPNLSYRDLQFMDLDSALSLYKIKEVLRAPGGYLIIEILEYRNPPGARFRSGNILHTAVYKKDLWGQYSKIDACGKFLG
ncbi:MAG: hypothetical protein AAGG51_05855 [Cyanobacteria bacterium P01_G01_bin.54]